MSKTYAYTTLEHRTTITINNTDITVALLSDNKRVIHVDSLFELFDIEELDSIKDTVNVFVNSPYIKPYITRELRRLLLRPFEYDDKGKKQPYYHIKAITMLCDLFTTRGYKTEYDEMFEIAQRIFIEMTVLGIEALVNEARSGVTLDYNLYVRRNNSIAELNKPDIKGDNLIPYVKGIGVVDLNETKFKVVMLNNNVRVITDRTLFKLAGVSFTDKKGFDGLPWFLSSGYLTPFRTYTLEHLALDRILYIDENKKKQTGYNITILPIMFEAYGRAYYKGAIHKDHIGIYHNLRKLFIGLSTVGFIDRVDKELKYIRPYTNPLSHELNTLISYKPRLRNMVIFDIHFYRPLYRLYKLKGNPDDLDKPKEVRELTDKILYNRLGKEVGNKLREISKNGNSFFLHLTEEVGFPIFKRMFVRAIKLMEKSKTVEEFEREWDTIYPMPER